MAVDLLRKKMHHQIDNLPADILHEVADFMSFVVERRFRGKIDDWDDETWQKMALEQFFRDDESGASYTLEDAVEVYEK